MSTRTRISRSKNPGAAAVHRPARYDRRLQHRKVRRATQLELSQLAEHDDYALPRPVHTSEKTDPSDRPEKTVRSRKFKVWKTKSWKRRKLNRAAKAAAYQQARKGEPETLPE